MRFAIHKRIKSRPEDMDSLTSRIKMSSLAIEETNTGAIRSLEHGRMHPRRQDLKRLPGMSTFPSRHSVVDRFLPNGAITGFLKRDFFEPLMVGSLTVGETGLVWGISTKRGGDRCSGYAAFRPSDLNSVVSFVLALFFFDRRVWGTNLCSGSSRDPYCSRTAVYPTRPMSRDSGYRSRIAGAAKPKA